MGKTNRIYRGLIDAGNILLNSGPFADPKTFFEPVRKEFAKSGHSRSYDTINYQLLKSWGTSLEKKLSEHNAKLSWTRDVSSYSFNGNCYEENSGKIHGDFPIPLKIQDLSPTASSEHVQAIIDIPSNTGSAQAVFRQQYGEKFLDHISVSEKYTDVKDIFGRIKDIPISLISTINPALFAENKRKWQELEYDSLTNGATKDFYLNPKSLKFSDFDIEGGSNNDFNEKIIFEYLNSIIPHIHTELYGIDQPFTPFIGLDMKSLGEDRLNELYSKLHDILIESIVQRNVDTSRFLSLQLFDFEFYATGRVGELRNTSHFEKHFSADEFAKTKQSTIIFPETYILHYNPKNTAQPTLITSIKETNNFYCIWMHDKNDLEKAARHIQRS